MRGQVRWECRLQMEGYLRTLLDSCMDGTRPNSTPDVLDCVGVELWSQVLETLDVLSQDVPVAIRGFACMRGRLQIGDQDLFEAFRCVGTTGETERNRIGESTSIQTTSTATALLFARSEEALGLPSDRVAPTNPGGFFEEVGANRVGAVEDGTLRVVRLATRIEPWKIQEPGVRCFRKSENALGRACMDGSHFSAGRAALT